MAECCGKRVRLVYSCSGAADVGEISDRVARLLVKKGFAKPSCLAGVGAHVSGFVASAQGEVENIVIDGCPVACARKTLEHVGVMPRSFVLTEMGLQKGKTEVSDEVIRQLVDLITGSQSSDMSKNPESGGQSCSCGRC
jgi:uncharacterized metal-binding protein